MNDMKYFVGVARIFADPKIDYQFSLSVQYANARNKEAAQELMMPKLFRNYPAEIAAGDVTLYVFELPDLFVESVRTGKTAHGDAGQADAGISAEILMAEYLDV